MTEYGPSGFDMTVLTNPSRPSIAMNIHQREAIARLATACESIIQRGLLEHDEELALRILTNQVCNTCDMAVVQDNEPYRERA